MSADSVVAEEFIISLLKADSSLTTLLPDGTGGIWLDVVPRTAKLPAVQVTFQGPTPFLHILDHILWSEFYYIVRAVCEGWSFVPVRAAAARIHELLDAQSGSTANGEVYGVHAYRPFRLVEVEGEVQYRHLGTEFRIYARET